MNTHTQTQVDTAQLGAEKYRFAVPEFLDYERGLMWYVVAGLIAGVLIVGSFLLGTPSFAAAVLIFVAVYFLLHHREARVLTVVVYEQGLTVDDKVYSAADISSFHFVWKPPFVFDLKIVLDRRVHPVLTLHAVGQDPAELRAALSHLAPEEEKPEPLTDIFIRTLRL